MQNLLLFFCLFFANVCFAGQYRDNIHVAINGKTLNFPEYENDFVTKCEFIPETRKFKIKGKHGKRHGRKKRTRSDLWSGLSQLFRCRECGKYLHGCKEAAEHYDQFEHSQFDKIDLKHF